MNTAHQLSTQNYQVIIDHELSLIRMRQAFIRELRGFCSEQAASLLLVEEQTLAAELYSKLYQRDDYMKMLDTHNCIALSKIPVALSNSILTQGGPLYISLRLAKPLPFDPNFERFECEATSEIGEHIESLIRRTSGIQSDDLCASEIATLNAMSISGVTDARQWLFKMIEAGPVCRQVANRMIDAICTLSVDRESCLL